MSSTPLAATEPFVLDDTQDDPQLDPRQNEDTGPDMIADNVRDSMEESDRKIAAITSMDPQPHSGEQNGLSENPWANNSPEEDADTHGFVHPRSSHGSDQNEAVEVSTLKNASDGGTVGHGEMSETRQLPIRESKQGDDSFQNEKIDVDDGIQDLSPPVPPPKDAKYLPMTPTDREKPHEQIEPDQVSASLEQLQDEKETLIQPTPLITDFNEKHEQDEAPNDSKSEIESIMGQFEDGQGDQSLDDVMSPRLHKTGTNLSVFQYPPRKSSLENLSRLAADSEPDSNADDEGGTSHTREGSISSTKTKDTEKNAPSFVSQLPPPEPDPEPDLPFDFHRFLEQLRHRTADPVARFLRSFLTEFGKKQWMVHEQVKIISDFLSFIGNRMAQCDVWRTVSEAEFDNAKEGMEKLVMNRLYTQTFSPEIPPPEPVSSKPKRKVTSPTNAQGRKGQHQEDVERDDILAQKVRIYGWIREEHLDLKPFSDKGRKFLRLAQQELSKIKAYRAPRDKVICVLNCCKVIFGFLRNAQSDQSADSFIPLLIYTVLKANPDHLVSNLQYILRFRNQDKLGGEAGYYISSLMGAVQFIENLDRTNLTISDEDFEKEVEASVSAIAERQQPDEKPLAAPATPSLLPFSEKSTLSRAEVTPRNSMEAERSSPRRGGSSSGAGGGSGLLSGPVSSAEESEEKVAVAGLLRTIQKPLSTIGRIFSDDTYSTAQPHSGAGTPHQPALTPQPGSTPPGMPPLPRQRSNEQVAAERRPSPSGGTLPSAPQASGGRNVHVFEPENALLPPGSHPRPQTAEASAPSDEEGLRARMAAEDAAARQASAEAAEAHRVEQAQHATVVETLKGMFPDLDVDVISDVVRMKQGRVGQAVDACLALSH